jgi:hypothetical protein
MADPKQKDWKNCPVYGPQLREWYIGKWRAEAVFGRAAIYGSDCNNTQHGDISPEWVKVNTKKPYNFYL